MLKNKSYLCLLSKEEDDKHSYIINNGINKRNINIQKTLLENQFKLTKEKQLIYKFITLNNIILNAQVIEQDTNKNCLLTLSDIEDNIYYITYLNIPINVIYYITTLTEKEKLLFSYKKIYNRINKIDILLQ